MRIYKIKFDGQIMVLDNIKNILEEARMFCEGMSEGESFSIKVGSMEEEEYKNLPESMGW